ncbi:MAG: saccharopine dehydrogenase NADP-binding domain-containing protein, partial [Solirubrobacterales bacterium]
MARQRGPIALYGATGYTGRLVAKELTDAGADFVLSGRSQAKLEALAEELGRSAPCHSASIENPDSLRSLLADCAVVIDCAGPFTTLGEPVLKAAIETSTHYLDTTGEQGYMNLVFKRYGAEAERNRVAAIPAMGFDYVPGDMIASLSA